MWYNGYTKEETVAQGRNSASRERPWHVNVTPEQVEHAKNIFSKVEKTGDDISYAEDKEGRHFFSGTLHLGSFDMWGNLVIANELV